MCVVALLVLSAHAPASAQSLLPPAGEPSSSQNRTELEALINTLEDDAARRHLVEQLRALSSAGTPAAGAGLQSLSDRLDAAVTARLQATARSLTDLAASVGAIPQLVRWLRTQLSDTSSRMVWGSVLSQTGWAVLLGLSASLLVRLMLQGWRARRLTLPASPSTRRKLVVAGARLAVDLLALLGFLAVAYAALQFLEVGYLARLVTLDLLGGVTLARMITAAARALLTPHEPRARLLPLRSSQAKAVSRWISTTFGLAIYGYVLLVAALRLGLPPTVHVFLEHMLFLSVTILVVGAILRVRPRLQALIASVAGEQQGWVQRLLPWETVAVVAPWALAAWAVLQYLAWAVALAQGPTLVTRGVLATILVLLLWRGLSLQLRPDSVRGRPGDDPEETEPAAAAPGRAPAFAVLTVVARLFAALVAAAIVLAAWGFDVPAWLGSQPGQIVLARALNVALVAAVAASGWYFVDRTAHRYITALDEAGNPVHDNRTRTLANIIRNLALTVALFVVVAHLLGALGVNTAALLAGAGVVGFAIGFGSQKLVQDLTTGLFILLGDTVRVGDVVQLGEQSGVVEAVSMRTVTLRDYNGLVHTIPYSSISIVTNMTKDYAFAVFKITVGYREDVDRIMDVLREIDGQLRREWPYRRIMLEPLDVAGVDAFTERGVVILARSRTRAGEQWKVSREFNRRLKNRFDELGIVFPYPHWTLDSGEPQPDGGRRAFVKPVGILAEPRSNQA